MAAQVGEVLGNLDLALVEQLLEMAHAEGAAAEEIDHPQARLVAQALIDCDEIHTLTYVDNGIYVNRNIYAVRTPAVVFCRPA